ncbi:MAG: serine/threonine-protein kinase [Phycisphaerales bacterium]
MSLSSQRWRRVEEIFHEVADLPQGDQTQAVLRLSGSDTWVAGQVLDMVRADRSGLGETLAHIEASTAQVRKDLQAQSRIAVQPKSIGPYTITRLLGQGGFGNVYLGEQTHPVKRLAAIKVVRTGTLLDTERVLQRFIVERRTLALLEHPAIARLIDAGETEDGQPYFSMEYVEGGLPITKACDECSASMELRLRLFARVCRAIQYAHQKGVIHRDIKPGNVLMGSLEPGASLDDTFVKVIDFGISKLLVPDSLGEEAFASRTHGHASNLVASVEHVIGTPEYMSPEQARSGGHEVDTRSDIYALGVLLHELVSGLLPHDPESLRAMGPVAACMHVAKEECPPVTARLRECSPAVLEEVARKRALPSSDALTRTIRGDLASIVARATAHEPQHRYESAEALAEDIENYLALRPVKTRRAGAMYLVSKFVRRNAARFVSIGLATLLAGAIVFGVVSREHSRTLARQQQERERVLAYETMIDAHARATLEMERGQYRDALATLERVDPSLRAWEWHVLRNCFGAADTIFKSDNIYYQVAPHPTQALFAIADWSGRAFVLDEQSSLGGFFLSEEKVAQRGRAGVAWSPDGSRLAFSSNDKVWIVPLDSLRASLESPEIKEANKRLVNRAFEPAVDCIDPTLLKDARAIPVRSRAARIFWSRDGVHIAVVIERSPTFDVCVINVESGRVVADDLGGCYSTAIIHPTRHEVIWGDRDGQLFAYDWDKREFVHRSNSTGEAIADIDLSLDGSKIAIASQREVRVLKTDDYSLADKLRSPTAINSVAWSPDGNWVAGGTLGETFSIWSAHTGALATSLPLDIDGVEDLAFSRATGKLIVPDYTGVIRLTSAVSNIIDLKQGRGGAAALPHGRLVTVRAARYSPSSRTSAQTGTVAQFFDLTTSMNVGSVDSSTFYGWWPWTAPHARTDSIAWMLDGQCLQQRMITSGEILSEEYVPDAKFFGFGGSRDRFVVATRKGWQVRDAATGSLLHDVEVGTEHAEQRAHVQLSPDGSLIYSTEPRNDEDPDTSYFMGTIRRADTGSLICVLNTDSETDVGGFLGDGSIYVASTPTEGLCLFDAKTGELLRSVDVTRGHLWTQVLPNQSRVISSSTDGTISAYDTATWRRVAQFRLDGIPAILEDGTLVVATTDRILRFLRP